jgi:hypothetical protein
MRHSLFSSLHRYAELSLNILFLELRPGEARWNPMANEYHESSAPEYESSKPIVSWTMVI